MLTKLFRAIFPKKVRTKVPKTERNPKPELVIINDLNMDIIRSFKIKEIVELRDGTFRVRAEAKLQGPVFWPIKKITEAAAAHINPEWPEWDMSVATNDGSTYRVRELIFKYDAASRAEAQAKLDAVAEALIAAEEPA